VNRREIYIYVEKEEEEMERERVREYYKGVSPWNNVIRQTKNFSFFFLMSIVIFQFPLVMVRRRAQN